MRRKFQCITYIYLVHRIPCTEYGVFFTRRANLDSLFLAYRSDFSRAARFSTATRSLAAKDGKVAIAQAGAIPHLVALLESGDADGKASAAGALMNLASKDGMVAIAQNGGIPHLVALLESGNANGKYYAAGALMNLASNADIRVAIAQAGAIPHLVALLESGNATVRGLRGSRNFYVCSSLY